MRLVGRKGQGVLHALRELRLTLEQHTMHEQFFSAVTLQIEPNAATSRCLPWRRPRATPSPLERTSPAL